MKFLVTVAVLLVAITSSSMALPAQEAALAESAEDRYYPYRYRRPHRVVRYVRPRPRPRRRPGPVNVKGANGGTVIGGNGANGGRISVGGGARRGGRAVRVNGANGGRVVNGNGANGGSITVKKRDEDFFFPLWFPSAPAATNGA